MKHVTFDISMITLFCWFIYGEEFWLFKKLQIQRIFDDIFTKLNVSFSRRFEPYGFFCLYSFCAPLIRMRGFVLTNGWMVQFITLCVNLALRQKVSITLILQATRDESHSLKLLVSL